VLESQQDGREYVFELKDRLIRDTELDGMTEIPLKRDDDVESDASGPTGGTEESVPSTLNCMSCSYIWPVARLFCRLTI